jgi:hypothetical protein
MATSGALQLGLGVWILAATREELNQQNDEPPDDGYGDAGPFGAAYGAAITAGVAVGLVGAGLATGGALLLANGIREQRRHRGYFGIKPREKTGIWSGTIGAALLGVAPLPLAHGAALIDSGDRRPGTAIELGTGIALVGTGASLLILGWVRAHRYRQRLAK